MNYSVNISPNNNINDVYDSANSSDKKTGKSVYMGNLTLGNDHINEKREGARKQAYKLISDAYNSDLEFEKRLKSIKDFASEKKLEKTAATQNLKNAYESLEELKKEYNVAPDSKEQQDLDWLLAYRKKSPEEKFSDIEQMKKDSARADEIMSNLTEYQSRMLEVNDQIDVAKETIDEADKALMSARQLLTDAESEKNKTHTMADAVKEAEAILDAAEQDVIVMSMNDAKDSIEEKTKEEQEEAKEKKEAEKEREKIEAKRAEKREIMEALAKDTKDAVREAKEHTRQRENNDVDITDILNTDTVRISGDSENLSKALDEIKNKMALVDADLKGIKVDETV